MNQTTADAVNRGSAFEATLDGAAALLNRRTAVNLERSELDRRAGVTVALHGASLGVEAGVEEAVAVPVDRHADRVISHQNVGVALRAAVNGVPVAAVLQPELAVRTTQGSRLSSSIRIHGGVVRRRKDIVAPGAAAAVIRVDDVRQRRLLEQHQLAAVPVAGTVVCSFNQSLTLVQEARNRVGEDSFVDVAGTAAAEQRDRIGRQRPP